MKRAHCLWLRLSHLVFCLYPVVAQGQNGLLQRIVSEATTKYKLELGLAAFIIFYLIYAWNGIRKNNTMAMSWLRVLGSPDGVLARNFTAYGSPQEGSAGQDLCWKESTSCYKCYASGRRYCAGALITLTLKTRQDLMTQLWSLLSPGDDVLEVEVFMNEAAMPPTVLVIGLTRIVKALTREDGDIAKFTGGKMMTVNRDRVPNFPVDRLAVAAEQPSLFYELLAVEPLLAKGLAAKSFRSAIINSEVGSDVNPPGPRLTFTFALPPLTDAGVDSVNTLLSCVFLFVDLLGGYKVSPDMRKRAQELREELAKKEAQKGALDRQSQLQQKKMERLEAERAKARAAGPAALAKFEEKLQAKLRNRELRRRVVKA